MKKILALASVVCFLAFAAQAQEPKSSTAEKATTVAPASLDKDAAATSDKVAGKSCCAKGKNSKSCTAAEKAECSKSGHSKAECTHDNKASCSHANAKGSCNHGGKASIEKDDAATPNNK